MFLQKGHSRHIRTDEGRAANILTLDLPCASGNTRGRGRTQSRVGAKVTVINVIKKENDHNTSTKSYFIQLVKKKQNMSTLTKILFDPNQSKVCLF